MGINAIGFQNHRLDGLHYFSVFVLEPLTEENIRRIIVQAIKRIGSSLPDADGADERPPDIITLASSSQDTAANLSQSTTATMTEHDDHPPPPFPQFPQCTEKIISTIASLSSGDARTALSLLELVLNAPKNTNPETLLAQLRQSVSTSYDRTGDSRYDMISALHKCVRGSQGSAAMYWLARMLSAGEDPMYIARRMTVCASEDVGLADPKALPLVSHVFTRLLARHEAVFFLRRL